MIPNLLPLLSWMQGMAVNCPYDIPFGAAWCSSHILSPAPGYSPPSPYRPVEAAMQQPNGMTRSSLAV